MEWKARKFLNSNTVTDLSDQGDTGDLFLPEPLPVVFNQYLVEDHTEPDELGLYLFLGHRTSKEEDKR